MEKSRNNFIDSNWFKWLAPLAITGIALIWGECYYSPIRSRLLRNGKYTIAYINNIRFFKGGTAPEFSFIYKGITYNSSESTLIQKDFHFTNGYRGKRFFVIFNPNDPNNCSLLSYNPVPDSIISVPSEGWEKLPVGELNNLIK